MSKTLRTTLKKVPGLDRMVRTYRARSRDWVLDYLPKNSTGAEIGVYLGDYSARILKVVQPEKLYLIDPWKHESGSEYERAWFGGSERSQGDLDRRHDIVMRRFLQERERGTVEVVRGESAEILEGLPDDSLDWVYIDGNHRYDYVHDDLSLSLRKVIPGGLITGDDYGVAGWWDGGVERAVDEFVSDGLVESVVIRAGQFVLRRPVA